MIDRIFRQQHFAFCGRNKHRQVKARVQTVEFFLADASQTRCLSSINGRGDIQSLEVFIVFDFGNVDAKSRRIGYYIAPCQQFWGVIARFLRHFEVFIGRQ